jgi:hypothetical protein
LTDLKIRFEIEPLSTNGGFLSIVRARETFGRDFLLLKKKKGIERSLHLLSSLFVPCYALCFRYEKTPRAKRTDITMFSKIISETTAAENEARYTAVTETSMIIVTSIKEYRTRKATLTCSHSQSFLKSIRKSKTAITNNTPPNILGWRGFVQPVMGVTKASSRKMFIKPNRRHTSP